MKKSLLMGLFFGGICVRAAEVDVIPYPNQVTRTEQIFTLGAATRIAHDGTPGAKAVALVMAEELRRVTGYPFPLSEASRAAKNALCLLGGEATLGPEGYTLETSGDGVVCTATGYAGFFYAWQTIRQLLPVEVFGSRGAGKAMPMSLPGVSIRDAPRFAWRGLLIDEGRHFFGKEAIRKQLDIMAAHKLNVMHWHITDDQGWRIEIKKYPELTQKGAIRDASPVKWSRSVLDKTPYGPFFYTQEEIRELVAYAKARNITIVPEIEMPGHAMAVFAAYPEMMCKPRENVRPRCTWGVEEDVFCAGNDQTLTFLQDVLDEVIPLFDSEFIHIGGDECPKARWKSCPKCQARIKALGLKDEHQLQSWFVQHFTSYIAKKGKRAIGWDEILEGGLPKGAAVMSWRGVGGGIQAAKAGHQVVMTPTSHLYFDYGQYALDPDYEYIGGLLTLEKVYGFNPTDGIPAEMHGFVRGCQGNNWTEYTWTQKELEWKCYPRACALAEVAWTQPKNKGWGRFSKTWENVHSNRLKALDVNYATGGAKPPASWSSGMTGPAWKTLEWTVTTSCPAAGDYTVIFKYTGGQHRLDIRKAAFVVNSTSVSTDAHEGTTGSASKNNTYRLSLPQEAAGKPVVLRAEVRSDGGDDSNGYILIRPSRK